MIRRLSDFVRGNVKVLAVDSETALACYGRPYGRLHVQSITFEKFHRLSIANLYT